MPTFRFVDFSVYWRFGLSTFRFVDVLACRRFGLSTFCLKSQRPVPVLSRLSYDFVRPLPIIKAGRGRLSGRLRPGLEQQYIESVITTHDNIRSDAVTIHSSITWRFIEHWSTSTTHYCDTIMGTVASQITSRTIAYTAVYSDVDQSKHQSSASLAFVWGIHRGPVNSPHKWPVTRKMFPFDDVIMININ